MPEQIKVTTPAEVALSRGLTHTVQIEQEGYERQTVYIDRHASDAAKGNILIGGLIGICIDLSDGAAFDLVPQDINVQLQPTAQVATSPPQSSEIVDKPTVLPTGSSP